MNNLKQQKGAVLIVVLMILLLITTLGVYAIRQATTRLNISTNSQIMSILSATNDTAMRDVLDDMGKHRGNKMYPIEYLTSYDEGTELLFCYRPVSSTFVYHLPSTTTAAPGIGAAGSASRDNARDDLDSARKNGRCKLNTDFSDVRGFGVTQISVAMRKVTAGGITPPIYRVYVTSIAVSPFTGNLSAVQTECMDRRLNNDIDPTTTNQSDAAYQYSTYGRGNLELESLGECLARFGIPYQTKMQEVSIPSSDTLQVP